MRLYKNYVTVVWKNRRNWYQHFEVCTKEANQGLRTHSLKDHANCGQLIIVSISPHSQFSRSSNMTYETLISLPTVLWLVQHFPRMLLLCPLTQWTLPSALLHPWVTIALSCCKHTFLSKTSLLSVSQRDWADQVLSLFHLSPAWTL